MRTAKEIIEALLEDVEENEWTFEDRGREVNYCISCGACFGISHQPKVHDVGCRRAELMAEAKAYLESLIIL